MQQILLVEDDSSFRDVIASAFADAGYAVLAAPNGAAALALLEQSVPDLILLDIYLPVMDGRGFVRAYRQRPGPHAPILVMTGATYSAERAAALDAAGSLSKPFTLNDLRAKVQALIGSRATGAKS